MKALLSEAAPAYRYSGLPVPVGLVDQVLGLLRAHGDAVEGHVVVDGVGVADQAVVGDDLDAGLAGFVSGGGGSGAVLRADDEDFDALGDQRFDVLFFLGGRALAEEDFDFVSGGFQRVLEAGLVLDPARLILGRQDDADRQFAFGGSSGFGGFCGRRCCFCRFGGRRLGGWGAGEQPGQHSHDHNCVKQRLRDLAKHIFSSRELKKNGYASAYHRVNAGSGFVVLITSS